MRECVLCSRFYVQRCFRPTDSMTQRRNGPNDTTDQTDETDQINLTSKAKVVRLTELIIA
ncbi:hypothetical protein J7J45_01840 [Candidatus Aerophobetes bacterium]|nr:hypothetical protein [Candidatus Aerophobetes bacterium]